MWIALWLRWFGSRPHLAGAGVALLFVGAALLGVLETLLRPHFGIWWTVVLAGYFGGWLLTSIVMWLPGRLRPGVTPRSWASTVLPELDAPKQSGVRERKTLFTVGMVLFVSGVSFALLMLLGPDRTEAVGGIMSGITGVIGALIALNANARLRAGPANTRPEPELADSPDRNS